jgi:hypothetical protein
MANRINASSRIIMRIELSPQAKERFVDYGDSLGMTQVAVASRLVEWLTKQNDVIQAAVLGLYPEDIRAEVPSLLLKHLIAEKKA